MNAPTGACVPVGLDERPSKVLLALRRFVEDYLARYGTDPAQVRVLHRLLACRTEAMGTHPCVCESCGWRGLAFNPCRDRHCPQCQGQATAEWLENRRARLLPVPHFQVVFTLPADLRPIALDNPRLVYDLLFHTAASVLKDLAEQRLEARLGVTAVLHTWARDLTIHPHAHLLVSAGGLSLDGERWVDSSQEFLFPGKVMGAMFRGRFLEGLIAAFEEEELQLRGEDPVAAAKAFRSLVSALAKRHARWVVHVEPPKGRSAELVLKYLARYVKRVAIHDARMLEVTDTEVVFRARRGLVRVDGVEFVRRFAQHILPQGFRKVRHYGLYAPGMAGEKLEKARELLGHAPVVEDEPTEDAEKASSRGRTTCPRCGQTAVRHLPPSTWMCPPGPGDLSTPPRGPP